MAETRDADITAFLKTCGWHHADRKTIAGDASNRRYDRLTRSDGRVAVLMDAPPDRGETIRPFINVTSILRDQSLSAPEIFAQDTQHGFLLLEDLGDALFAKVVQTNPELERPLYEAAVDVLVHLHQAPPPDLLPYDSTAMTPLAALAFDWYAFGATGVSDARAKAAFEAACHDALAPLDPECATMIQRDYHAENLIWLPDRLGVARVGLLDYQDAMRGHRAYDLMSILQDARRDVPPALAQAMISRYVTTTGVDHDTFVAAYACLGMQRHMRILGVFARLSLAHGKPHYVDLIPRVWAHLVKSLEHPVLEAVAPTICDHLPEPTAQVCATLRDKCGSRPL